MKLKSSAKEKILEAALSVIRAQGYAATTVDDLCAAAGVTKGAFFHHFDSKEDLAVAAAEYWSDMTGKLFAAAPYHMHHRPLDRVLAYVDFRKSILQRSVPEFTCLVGTMVQEAYDSSPAIRDACARSIVGHAQTLEDDINAAIKEHGIAPPWTASSLALFTQGVLQGSFILAKATNGSNVAADCVDHLRRYIEMLFSKSPVEEYAR